MKDEETLIATNFRIPKGVSEWIKRKADERDRSKNYIINELLRNAKEADEQKQSA